jgi:putative oxidoreductase
MKFIPQSPPLVPSFGLLALRLVAGTAMAMHGWPKIQNMTSWMGPDAPVPGFLQAAAAIAEFGGGICWAVGFLTPVASLLILVTMGVAMNMHIGNGDPFVGKGGGPSWELAAVYASIAVTLLLGGPGMHSIDQVVFNKKCEEV